MQGIVYLHGRLRKPDIQARAGYVISSADFGRAYLAEGWAARFVKALRERYTIVLLGYSANDPPMRYLLEGLHSRENTSYGSPIYAFAAGISDQIEEEWQDRGITPISYQPNDSSHSGLWDTLAAWATFSQDASAWDTQRISLAQRLPSTLRPYERGLVANLVSSKAGAKLFADASPTPPAEWLCVFDPHSRYAKPRKKGFKDHEEIDPLDLFGLDDDPPRPPPQANEQTNRVGVDYLSWRIGDTSYPERNRLAGWNPEWANQLPERLHHLSRWFGRVAHHPAAAWWAAGFFSLHPNLAWFVNRQLRDGTGLPETAQKFWRLYFEAAGDRPVNDQDFRWYEFEETLKHGGWSPYAFREFERCVRPSLIVSRYAYGPPRPPIEDWDEIDLSEVVHMKVRVLDRHGTDDPIPDEHLAIVVAIIRRSLVRAAELLHEIGTKWWRTPTLHPTGERGETFHGRKEQYFLWFKSLFRRLADVDPPAARAEVLQWEADDPYFFGKLFIYAQMDPGVASGSDAATALTRVSDEIFWDTYTRRELLFTLRARWPEFALDERRALEKRVIDGRPRVPGTKAAEYRRRRDAHAASILRWLEINGCEITPLSAAKMPGLKTADPQWTDEWALSADDSFGPRGGWIEKVTELRGLDELPVGEIVTAAAQRTEDRHDELRHFRPFEGLVSAAPLKALSALRFAMRRSTYPLRYWESLLSSWPDDTPLRLRWLLARTLSHLPKDVALGLRHYLPDWIKKHLAALATKNRTAALSVFDAIMGHYVSASPGMTDSSIGETRVGGIQQDRSEVSFDKAINSPSGKLTECLFSIQRGASKTRPFPKFMSDRLKVLFSLPGNGAGHAVCVTTQKLGWLDFYFRDWVKAELVPLFSLDDPRSEGAWHGLAHDQNRLSAETLKAINRDFLRLLAGQAPWKLNEREYHTHLRRLVWLSRKNGAASPIVTFAQARTTLMAIDNRGRADALTALSNILSLKGEWRAFIKPFIENAWPRQIRYKSEETSRAFARLMDDIGEDFPDGVKTVMPFLRPVPHLDMITYRLVKEQGNNERDLAVTYPGSTLAFLDALVGDDRASIPYELSKVLEIIAEADPSLRQSRSWRRLHDLST